MERLISLKAGDLFAEFVIAVRMSRGENFRRDQVWLHALNVTAATGSESQTEPVRFRMEFEKAFDRSKRRQDRECLVELLYHIQGFTS